MRPPESGGDYPTTGPRVRTVQTSRILSAAPSCSKWVLKVAGVERPYTVPRYYRPLADPVARSSWRGAARRHLRAAGKIVPMTAFFRPLA